MDAKDRTIAKLQRSAERRGQHLLGLMDRNDSLRYEVKRLQEALISCYFRPHQAAAIAEDAIPKHMAEAIRRHEENEGR